jgi:hypothetical protein
MADDYNRLAMYAAPVAPENRLAQAVLPQGHPSNMLMWLRDQIPQVQADDTSTASGIYSRLGRTATAIPRAGLETMSNWLRGTHDPSAVRIGEDTIAPLGLFGMGTGMANALTRAPKGAVGHIPADAPIQRAGDVGAHLPRSMHSRNFNEAHVTGGTMHREDFGYGGERIFVMGPDGATLATRTEDAIRRPSDMGVKFPGAGRPANDLLSDNAKSSVPGVVVQGLDMSQEARLGRAREQGFDTSRTWHHGTDAEFDAFQARPAPPYSGGSSVPAVWLTSSPRVAGAFAEAGGQPGRVIDTHIAAPNLEVVERGFRSPDWETMDPILQRAREAGKDGVMFKRSNDHPDSMVVDPRVWNASDVVAMFNPSNIRSTQAAFDPANAGKNGLLLSDGAKSSVPGTAASASQQPDNAVLDILSRYGLY